MPKFRNERLRLLLDPQADDTVIKEISVAALGTANTASDGELWPTTANLTGSLTPTVLTNTTNGSLTAGSGPEALAWSYSADPGTSGLSDYADVLYTSSTGATRRVTFLITIT